VSPLKNDGYKKLICKKCNWESFDYNNKSGCITEHLLTHGITFDKSLYLNNFEEIILTDKDFWKCPYCDWKTVDYNNKSGCIINHIKNTHNMSIEFIVQSKLLDNINSKKKDDLLKQQFLSEDEKNRIECKICGKLFKKLSNTHLFKHQITPDEYKNKYDIDNTSSKYTSDIQSEYTTKHNLVHGSQLSNNQSSLELDFLNKLKNIGLEYVSPFLFEGSRFDVYLPQINSVIEIDGDAYHKNKLESLTIQTINGSVNDYIKNFKIKKSNFVFYRIRYDTDKFIFNNTEELVKLLDYYRYFPDYSINYNQKITTKKYFENYIKYKGVDKLKKYSRYFLKFIRTFQPSLPYPDLEESLQEVIDKISKYDFSKVYNSSTNEFSNNTSTIGHNYLKHHFHSYWKSKFNGNKSPEEAWQDDKIMKEIIEYRIGCNNSNEIFDFTLHQLVRGLSARRITVSFFKPILAAAIYKHYLGDKFSPMVLDPCCGFGGRLLGFKSVYPDGVYVGCEPNVETYNELLELKNKNGWSDGHVRLYNCKFEDFIDENYNYDFVFTSIPYYDLEVYSNKMEYKSFNDWRDVFIKSIEQYSGRNCYINATEDLCIKLGWKNIDSYILSNRSHFDKKEGEKKEWIVKL
jgi:hypothetical protein